MTPRHTSLFHTNLSILTPHLDAAQHLGELLEPLPPLEITEVGAGGLVLNLLLG